MFLTLHHLVKFHFIILVRASRLGFPPQQSSPLVAFRNFDEEMKRPGVWGSDEGSSSAVDNPPRDNLATLYRPPFHLMFQGPFEKVIFFLNIFYLYDL